MNILGLKFIMIFVLQFRLHSLYYLYHSSNCISIEQWPSIGFYRFIILLASFCVQRKKVVQWNPDFSNPRFFETRDNSNKKSFSFLSQTLHLYPQSLEPIFVSLGGSRNQDSTVHHFFNKNIVFQAQAGYSYFFDYLSLKIFLIYS